jgi:hypothetical protein
MRKTISVKYLKSINACDEAIGEFAEQHERNTLKLFDKIIKSENHIYLAWANWLIIRLMNDAQRISYAIYAAKQVLPIYEKKYPKDNRPRTAIVAAEKCIKSNTKKNKDAAHDAYSAAVYAACAATNPITACDSAARAAQAAAYAAQAAVAYTPARSAHAAVGSANIAYAEATDKMKTKILQYGLNMLEDNV